MATTKKAKQGAKFIEGKEEDATPDLKGTVNAESTFQRPRVNEQARRQIMEEYKYGDKYHD